MTQENKELILRDLCCRLPYGVKCENFSHVYGKSVFKVTDVRDNGYICGILNNQHFWAVFNPLDLKPYLFPLSSMTEEQDREFSLLQVNTHKDGFLYVCDCVNMITWLLKNHFDIYGLIPLGLAKDATNLNIY